MYNTIFSKMKNFFQQYKQKIEAKEQELLHNSKQVSALVNFLNRYSIFFHVLLACSICFVIEWASRHSFVDAFHFVFDRSLVYLYNSLIVFASLTLVYLFRRRILMRTLVSVFWLVLGIINSCVLLNRVTPFGFTDLKLVSDLFSMINTYFTPLDIMLAIAGVGFVIFAIALLWIKAPKFQGTQHKFVSIISLGSFVLLIPMVTHAAVNNNVLASYFENIAQGYKDYGFVYSFSASVVDRGMHEPENYTENTIQQVLNNIENKETVTTKDMPNIICVLLESFVDPNEINFLEYSQDPTPNFHALYDNYTSGHLEVPVVGAGTANTEFEVLTGMGIQFFGLGEYPYKTVLTTNTCESIAGNLSKLGYGTHAVHNNDGNFYGRDLIFSQMGFDSFTSKELMNIQEWTPLGSWPKDNCLIDEVKNTLDSTPDNPDFTYTITVQAHGAYPTEKVLTNPAIAVTGASTEEANNQWEYYINMIHEVDQFIGDLTEMLSEREEKTMVVFFGDHLPTMGLTEVDMATKSLFQTKYITWNNFGLENNSKDLTTYQLLSYALDQLDIHQGTMVNYHQTNDYKVTESYETNMELLQYDILYGNRYTYGGLDLYPASDLIMGTEEVEITSLSADEQYLQISGNNFTPWSKVFVNDDNVSTLYVSSTELRIELRDLADGDNTIVVNQMGSSDTVYRSSNVQEFYFEN